MQSKHHSDEDFLLFSMQSKRHSDEDLELLRDTFDDIAAIASTSEDSDSRNEECKLCNACRKITIRLLTRPGYQHTVDYNGVLTASGTCSMCNLILNTLRESDRQFDQSVRQVYRRLAQQGGDDSASTAVAQPFSITLFTCLSKYQESVEDVSLFAHASLRAGDFCRDVIGKFKLYDCPRKAPPVHQSYLVTIGADNKQDPIKLNYTPILRLIITQA
jgi:hypothetical protein